MNKGKTLQDKLARSLDQANKKDATAHRQTPAPAPVSDSKCKKIAISLFDSDQAKLKEIQVYMAGRGEMISVSQAVRLALRTAPLSEELAQALQEAKKDDGRGKW